MPRRVGYAPRLSQGYHGAPPRPNAGVSATGPASAVGRGGHAVHGRAWQSASCI